MKTKFAKVFLGVLAGLMAAVAIGQVNIQWPNGAPASGAVLYATTTSGQLGFSNLLLYGAQGTGAMQLSATQTTAPTCLSGCGTSPSIAGTDTAGTVTMGASGSPASPWLVAFNGTWAAAPSCIVISSKSGMAATKIPIVVTTSTTQFGVTTSSVAPSTSDTYSYQCFGVK